MVISRSRKKKAGRKNLHSESAAYPTVTIKRDLRDFEYASVSFVSYILVTIKDATSKEDPTK